VIPFIWNLFPQNSRGNPSFQTGPKCGIYNEHRKFSRPEFARVCLFDRDWASQKIEKPEKRLGLYCFRLQKPISVELF